MTFLHEVDPSGALKNTGAALILPAMDKYSLTRVLSRVDGVGKVLGGSTLEVPDEDAICPVVDAQVATTLGAISTGAERHVAYYQFDLGDDRNIVPGSRIHVQAHGMYLSRVGQEHGIVLRNPLEQLNLDPGIDTTISVGTVGTSALIARITTDEHRTHLGMPASEDVSPYLALQYRVYPT